MSRTETRPCDHCGKPFPWSSRYPIRRYCHPRCKTAAARELKNARRRELRRLRTTITRPQARPGPNQARTNHGGHDQDRMNPEDRPARPAPTSTPNAVQDCPHCRGPIAVFNLLLTPDAAYVNTPSQSVT